MAARKPVKPKDTPPTRETLAKAVFQLHKRCQSLEKRVAELEARLERKREIGFTSKRARDPEYEGSVPGDVLRQEPSDGDPGDRVPRRRFPHAT